MNLGRYLVVLGFVGFYLVVLGKSVVLFSGCGVNEYVVFWL